ncbi:MAG TPA: hypothetical protein VNA20_17405 [Frankiaceae bacterium]|nr:hypothetical protein [Frankiaceae bacterium]
MTAEDRLRAALGERAAAARTSPEALDRVFHRVGRHRRNVRAAVAGLAVVAVVAGTAVAATGRGGTGALQPVGPPAASTPPADRTPVPTTTPRARPTRAPAVPSPTLPERPSPTTTARPETFPKDSAMALLRDGRIAVVSTTTGEPLATVGRLPGPADERASVEWSPDRRRVYYDTGDCSIVELLVATGTTSPVGPGRRPEVAPDGRVAAIGCADGVAVYEPGTWRRSFFPDNERSDNPGPSWDASAATADVAWEPAGESLGLLLTRIGYEAYEMLWLDVENAAEVQSGHAAGPAAGLVDVTAGRYLTATYCCRNGGEPRSTLTRSASRDDGAPREVVHHGAEVTDVAADLAGTALFVDATGLWRIDGDTTRLLSRDVVAVG